MLNQKCVDYGKQGSAIRELFEYGKQRKAIVGEENVYDFSLGNPNVPCPEEYNDELIRILKEQDRCITQGYTSSIGDKNARDAIATQLNELYQADVDSKYIYLTCGAAAGLAITMNGIISSEEDEVLLIAPFFPEYSIWIDYVHAKRVISVSDKDMLPDFDDLEKKINPNTRILLIDSPNNPTGVVYGEEVIIKLSDLLRKKEKEYGHPIYLLSDEPYRELIYSDKKYPFVTRYYDDSIVVYSFSKSLSLPGARIGYVVVNPKATDCQDVYNAIKGAGRLLGFVNAPALYQFSLPKAVTIKTNLAPYEENRKALYEGLTKIGYDVIYPEGAFYMFVKSLEDDAMAFSEVAKKYDLLIVPSDSFGIKGYIRLAYCVKHSTIVNSMSAFEKLYHEYKG